MIKSERVRRWCWVCGVGAVTGFLLPLSAQTDVGNFRVPDVNEEGVLESLLTGEKARMYADRPMWIEGLIIEFFEDDGETVRIRITSPGCDYDTRRNYAESDRAVNITGNDFTIDGVGYKFDSNTSRMEILSQVRVVFTNSDLSPHSSSSPSSTESAESERP